MRKILLEGRTIKTAQDAINLLDSGKLAGRLGGKKFVPNWITEQPDMFKSLVDLTLINIDDDPNVAGDEVIQFMILASSTGPERWQSVVVEVPDVLNELSKALATQWFTKSAEYQERLQGLINNETFSIESWHALEKDIQEEFSKRQAKKHKTISNVKSLYDVLYEDSHWKLCVPKSFEGSIELASHIKPFNSHGSSYTKTRWCTAADRKYYEKYTNNGQTKLYIIQYWSQGEYKEAWQIAFDINRIEFMNKHDKKVYSAVKKAPSELLEQIIVDHPDNKFSGWNLKELWGIAPDSEDLNSVFSVPVATMIKFKPEFYLHQDILWMTKDCKKLLMLDPVDDLKEFHIPESVEYLDDSAVLALRKVHTLYVPRHFCECRTDRSCLSWGGLFNGDSSKGNSIQKLVFAEGIQEIPDHAACYFGNLVEVVLPSTVTSIAGYAFFHCERLKHIDLPTGLKRIGEAAFEWAGLESIKLPDNIDYIGREAFGYCDDLVQVELPDHKIEAESYVFKNCPKLQKVTNMRYLADVDRAFKGCAVLDISNLTNYLTKITKDFYGDRKDLNDFVVTDLVEEIDSRAFADSTLKTIILGKNVKIIGEEAFEDCEELEVVDFSKATSLKRIEEKAFKGCHSLKEIILPESLEYLGKSAFENCETLKNVTIQGNALRTLRRYTFAACENLEHIVIPESVRKIYKGCFSSCHSLQQIDLSSRLIFLDEYAFSSCRSLKTITLPKGIAYIPSFCFSNCTALETVKVSTKLAIVNHRAFGDCRNLTELTPYGDLDDFDLYSDVYFMPFSFDGSPFEEVLIAADAIDNDD